MNTVLLALFIFFTQNAHAVITVGGIPVTEAETGVAPNAERPSPKKPPPYDIQKDHRFEETRMQARTLLRDYPPNQTIVVGLGRTTGVTGAWANELAGTSSYFRYSPAEKLKDILKLSPEDQDKVWSKILPSKSELGNKKLVIHRHLWSGQTARQTVNSLIKHLERNGYPMPFTYDVVGDKPSAPASVKGKLDVKVHRSSIDSYAKYVDDLDWYEKQRNPDKTRFIDFGDKKPATVKDLLGGDFKSNPMSAAFKEAIDDGTCATALSYFQ